MAATDDDRRMVVYLIKPGEVDRDTRLVASHVLRQCAKALGPPAPATAVIHWWVRAARDGAKPISFVSPAGVRASDVKGWSDDQGMFICAELGHPVFTASTVAHEAFHIQRDAVGEAHDEADAQRFSIDYLSGKYGSPLPGGH